MGNIHLPAACMAACLGFAAAASSQGRLYRYAATPLPAPPSALGALYANAVNDRGEAVGFYSTAVTVSTYLAWFWSARTGLLLPAPLLPAGDVQQAVDINDNGDILGVSANYAPRAPYLSWVLHAGGGLTLLPGAGYRAPGTDLFYGYAITDQGMVAGTQRGLCQGPNECEQLFGAMVWTPSGGYAQIGGPPSTTFLWSSGTGSAGALNDSGMIACSLEDLTTHVPAAAVLTASGLTPIAVPGATSSAAVGINNRGDVRVNWYTCTTHGGCREYGIWSAGRLTTLPPAPHSWTGWIDDAGRAYGLEPSTSPRSPAVLWQAGTTVRLNDLIERATASPFLASARIAAVSDSGRYLIAENPSLTSTIWLLTQTRPALALQIDPHSEAWWPAQIPVETTLTFTTLGGEPGQPTAVLLENPVGTPLLPPLSFGLLDGEGKAAFSITVPPAVRGYTLGFRAIALDSQVGVIDSESRAVAFQ